MCLKNDIFIEKRKLNLNLEEKIVVFSNRFEVSYNMNEKFFDEISNAMKEINFKKMLA